MPLTQQGDNVKIQARASLPCHYHFNHLARIQKGVGGKEDKSRHMTPFPLAQGAQEIVNGIALVPTVRVLPSVLLFPITARVVD